MQLLLIDIETPHSHNLINKSDPLQSILKAEAQISALKSYVKCEISGLNNKMDSLKSDSHLPRKIYFICFNESLLKMISS